MVQMDNHQVIAENLAASSVPGFRRNQATFESVLSPMMAGAGNTGIKGLSSPAAPQLHVTPDFTQGQLQPDGNPSHLAISGDGFFVVQLPDGSQGYTRSGSFHLNSQGELVNGEGLRLLTESGQPLTLAKPNEPFLISDSGDVSQGNNLIGKIQIASFKDANNDLHLAGNGIYGASEKATPEPMPAETTLRQGFLEGSNVNPVQEMVSMIQASRSYEANQKMLQAQDSTLDQVINKVASR